MALAYVWPLAGVGLVPTCAAVYVLGRLQPRKDQVLGEWFDDVAQPSILIRTRDLRYIAINSAYLELLGYRREEIIGIRAPDLQLIVDPGQRANLFERFRAEKRIRDIELRLRGKDGTIHTMLSSMASIQVGGEEHMIATLVDISARRRVEEALRESDSRFRNITDAIRSVFWLTDVRKQEMLYVSPGYEAIWGRSCASLLANPSEWMEAIHPADRNRVAVAATELQPEGGYDEEYRIVRADGTIRHIHDRAFPVRDESGEVIRIAGVAEDVTERRALEEQLRQTQKLESVGLLAGGIAHDFNNLLGAIATCSGLLGESISPGSEDRELVDDIDTAVQRATGLTRQLLAFSRKEVVEPVVLDLNACVTDTRKMLRRMIGEDVELTTDLDPDLHRVRVDPGYLVQVIMNLCVNARDAMPKGGTLEIATYNIAIDEARARRFPVPREGRAVVLVVSDTGCGMSPDVVRRVFEPFFTTKGVGRGTGMGLSVVAGIVEQAGGHIEVQSKIDVGTRFEVYLPATDAALAGEVRKAKSQSGGAETVLLVDDDDHVRKTAARALRSRGYTVLEAAGGLLALAVLAKEPGVSLMVTDVVMPGMDGRELAEAAQRRFPKVKVLYTSGYTDDTVVRRGVNQGQVELIEKPFRVETLAAKVRQVLDT